MARLDADGPDLPVLPLHRRSVAHAVEARLVPARARRTSKLIGLGLFLALYPYFPIAELRWPGVLQRIGLCYLAAWAAKRCLRPRGQAVLAAVLLVGYWLVMTRVSGPELIRPASKGRRTSPHRSTACCWFPTSGARLRPGTRRACSRRCRRSPRRSSACCSASGCSGARAARRFGRRWACCSEGSCSRHWAWRGASWPRPGCCSRSTRGSGPRPTCCSPLALRRPCSGFATSWWMWPACAAGQRLS